MNKRYLEVVLSGKCNNLVYAGYFFILFLVVLIMNARDTKIIQAILSGKNENVLQVLYDSSFRKIKEFIKKNSGKTEDAEDVFQDAVVSFYKLVKTGKFDERFDIDAFLYTAARNGWVNKVKRDSKMVEMPENIQTQTDQSGLHSILDKERTTIISQVFEKLGTKCRDLLTLVVYFDNSMKDVSEKLGLQNENAAKTQHYKCKQKLIELMGENASFKQLLRDAS